MINNKNFYPTPTDVIATMLSKVIVTNKIILEPSAGKGDIIDALKINESGEIIACENDKNLIPIVKEKADRFLMEDFLNVKKEDVSHIDLIIMNPPFSEDLKHIRHAFDIAPSGCEIVSLLNADTWGLYRNQQSELKKLFSSDGNTYTFDNLENAFSEAERKTEVNTGLLHIIKEGSKENEFEGYFDMTEDIQSENGPGVERYNEIQSIINSFISSVKMYDSVMTKNHEINNTMSFISTNRIEFGARDKDGNFISRSQFKKELQKSAWQMLFNKMDMGKYLTSSVKGTINKFVETQQDVPFTMKNVFAMFEMVYQTTGQRMLKVIEEVFDKLTKHYHDNRFSVEGWKTNSEYMVNKKFIMDYMVETGWHDDSTVRFRYDSVNNLDDLVKALCYITAKEYDYYKDSFENFSPEGNYMPGKEYFQGKSPSKDLTPGKWYEYGFFRFKVFKKGTMHCEFLDEKLWMEFNRLACKSKGFMLAEKYAEKKTNKEKNEQKPKSPKVEIKAIGHVHENIKSLTDLFN